MNYNFYIEQDIPFKEHGRDLDGMDCWGLVQHFYKHQLNIDLPSYITNYNDTKDSNIAHIIQDEALKYWRKVHDPQNGDVVLVRMRNRPMHVGIYKNPWLMLHIEEKVNTTFEKLRSIKWQKRILGIYRLSV